MKSSTQTAAWATTDEIRYLKSVVARNGKPISDRTSITVNARHFLLAWLYWHRKREWPSAVNVTACEREARLLLESLE